MKKALIVIFLLILIILPVVADTQSGPTTGTLTDNSLVFKGYYQGEKESYGENDTSIVLEFKDYSSTVINHDAQQGTSGTTITAVNNRHVGNNTGTIFTWAMKGTTTSRVTLTFSFSTFQALSNGKYFVPAYSIKLTQNQSKIITETVVKDSNGNITSGPTSQEGNYNNDPFYSNVVKTAVNITERPEPTTSENLAMYSVSYQGTASGTSVVTTQSGKRYTTTTKSWYRSGTCTLNISDYEEEVPGSYRYVCWVIAEFSVQ